MTAPSPNTTSTAGATGAAGGRDDAFVAHLLHLRATSTTARSALRRGDSPALADAALPYLAAWHLPDAQLHPACLLAAALSRYADLAHDPQMPLGRAAYLTLTHAERSDPSRSSDSGPGRRVLAAQRQTLPVAHRAVLGLLDAVNDHSALGLDWTGLWRLYRSWDHRDLQRRRDMRQRLLLDFYGAGPTPTTRPTPHDQPTEEH